MIGRRSAGYRANCCTLCLAFTCGAVATTNGGEPIEADLTALHTGASIGAPNQAWLGYGTTFLPDLDGDGVGELAVGSLEVNLTSPGSVWILFLNAAGAVKHTIQITDGMSGIPSDTISGARFGSDITWLGDLDDGVTAPPTRSALAVGQSHGSHSTGGQTGVVWILFLHDATTPGTPGTVQSLVKIANGSGGLSATTLDSADGFGNGMGALADLDNNGVPDLAVGAPGDDDGVTGGVDDQAGAVWILSLDSSGQVIGQQKISAHFGNGPPLNSHEYFGDSIAYLGDLSVPGDMAPTPHAMAVGSTFGNDVSALGKGNVRVLFLNDHTGPKGPAGTVHSYATIGPGTGGLPGSALKDGDHFGRGVTAMGDLNQDGLAELGVGLVYRDDGGMNAGAVWILSLAPTGKIVPGCLSMISATESCFGGALGPDDRFGESLDAGDYNGDGVVDLAVGSSKYDGAGTDSDDGAVWLMGLVPCAAATFSNYGQGTSGTLCDPTLTVSAPPVLGTGVDLLIDNCFSATVQTTAILLFGLQPAMIPGLGGTLLLVPIANLQVTLNPGTTAVPLDIPCEPMLCGFTVYMQVLQVNPGVPFNVTWTPRLDLTFGS